MNHLMPPTADLPQPPLADAYDVIVMGGGPAGAATAALLAEQGHQTLLLERQPVPRFHVGESLIPETYWPLARLGLIDQLKASSYPQKFSVQFVSDGHKESTPFYFDQHNQHESSQTWQVERATFDKMLLDNAVSRGAVLRTDAHVTEVLFDEDQRAGGVRVKLDDNGDRSTRDIACRVVVDATGQTAFLSTRLGLRERDPNLRKGTIWAYWQGAIRGEGRDAGATLIMQTRGKRSWFWWIPLRDDIVSIGCTGDMTDMFAQGQTAEDVYQRELERCPALERRLEPAQRVSDYLTTKDFSYHSTQGAGDGWVLVGDAFSFIDPVYSSGVYLAMQSGVYAADAISEAFAQYDLSGHRLGRWQPAYRAGVENFRKLVYAFYNPQVSIGGFLKEHPQFHDRLVDILIGDVFKQGFDEMFAAMGDLIPPASAGVARPKQEF